MKYAIFDWCSNRLFPTMEFNSFDDGWDYFLSQLPDEISDKEYDDACSEIFVLKIKK